MSSIKLNSEGQKKKSSEGSKEIIELKRFNQAAKFNTLPLEILKEIFCTVPTRDLFSCKRVCSQWYEIIKPLMKITKIKAHPKKKANKAIWNKYDSNFKNSSRYELKFYRASYALENVVDFGIISSIVRHEILMDDWEIYCGPTSITRAYDDIYHSIRYSEYDEIDAREEYTWWIILSMTQLDIPINLMRDLSKQKKFPRVMLRDFKWFTYSWDEDVDYYWEAEPDGTTHGIVVLYPDRRTFAILKYGQYDAEEERLLDLEEFEEEYSFRHMGCAYD